MAEKKKQKSGFHLLSNKKGTPRSPIITIESGANLPYRLTKRIGEGPHTKVFTAVAKPELQDSIEHMQGAWLETPPTNKIIVVKVITKRKHKIQSIRAEVETMSRLNHRNVVKFYGAYESHNNIYVIMQYASKGDLFDHAFPEPVTCSRPPMTEEKALIYFAQIINGLEYIHSKEMIHGDIKLENVFLDENDSVILGDFGMSRQFDQNEKGVFEPGTTLYGAPETCIGLKVRGPEVDIWSAGVVLYLLLQGRFPFCGETKLELLQSIGSTKLKLDRKHCSRETRDLVKSLLMCVPEKRITIPEIKEHPAMARVFSILDSKEEHLRAQAQSQQRAAAQAAAATAAPTAKKGTPEAKRRTSRDVIPASANFYKPPKSSAGAPS